MSGMIAEVSLPTVECPEPQLWRCFDVMSAEVEVLEFMSQLVKTIKPRLIVETGTFRGLAAFYMGRALRENGRGKLITCEVVPELHAKAKALIERGNMADLVDCRLESSLETKVEGAVDLLFTDSEPTLRVKEMERFWEQLAPSSVIVCHDVNSGAHKELRGEVLGLDEARRLSVVLLPTPRGLAICQKREGRE